MTRSPRPNISPCSHRSANRPRPLTYPDLVAAADVVVTKPGYGIVSECVANGTPLLYTSRGRFVEYDVFVAEMPRVLRCRYLPREDFLAGRWGAAVRALLAQTPPPERRADRRREVARRRSWTWRLGDVVVS